MLLSASTVYRTHEVNKWMNYELSCTISYIFTFGLTSVFSMVGRIISTVFAVSNNFSWKLEPSWVFTDQGEYMTSWMCKLYVCTMSFVQIASLIFSVHSIHWTVYLKLPRTEGGTRNVTLCVDTLKFCKKKKKKSTLSSQCCSFYSVFKGLEHAAKSLSSLSLLL